MFNANKEVFKFILSNRENLAVKILNKQFEYQPQLKLKYTPEDFNKCLKDISYHLSFLAESINVDNYNLFKDYIIWAKVLLQNVNIPTEHLVVNLDCIKEILSLELPMEMYFLTNFYIDNAKEFLISTENISETFIKDSNPYIETLNNYLCYVLEAERTNASIVIMSEVEKGTDIKEIYFYIFEPALKEIGRLWQINKITVTQEHYFTATTQLIMSQLYSKIFSSKKNGLKFVAACVNEELHEIGIRLVADVLEIDGWDTYYLGANVPKNSLIKFLTEKRPDVLGISSTMTFHLHKVIDIIEEVKSDDKFKNLKILVGGYPFNIDKNLWEKVGADLYAPNAIEASKLLVSIF